MNRRKFLKTMAYSSSLAMTGGLGLTLPFGNALASHLPNNSRRTLVNIMLPGGADLRYLFVPDPVADPLYAAAFWEARKGLYHINADATTLYPDYQTVWSELYLPVTSNGASFGILKQADWLKSQFDQGNVAIVANVIASDNRRHDHSQLIMNSGDIGANQYIYDRDGWGGRFVGTSGASNNVVAMNHDVSIFCNGENPANRLEHVIHMRNSRDFALPGPTSDPLSKQSILARSLKTYYESRGKNIENKIAKGSMSEDWPFRRFFQHENVIRTFGDTFSSRLNELQPNLPGQIGVLKYKLYDKAFAQQIANLYDSLITADILSLRSAYLEYGSWDTHNNQKNRFEKNISDLFGEKGGLGALTQELDFTPGINENLAYVFTSDFGRQLAANGAHGTDHGRGTYSIVVGRSVNGGVYGDMFPAAEYLPGNDGSVPPFQKLGSDIQGRTSFERVLSELCDWTEPGTGSRVFPNANNSIIETSVNLAALFKPGFGIRGKIADARYLDAHVTGTISSADIQVQVTDSAGNARMTHPDGQTGIYWLSGLDAGSYTITPSHSRMVFNPPQQTVTVNGGNITDADFALTYKLGIEGVVYRDPAPIADPAGDYIRYVFLGQGFEQANTKVSIGGVTCDSRVLLQRYLIINVPVSVVSGEIVITTSTETYTHPVLFENFLV